MNLIFLKCKRGGLNILKKIYGEYKDIIILSFIALFIGVIVGVIDACFGRVLISITEFRDENVIKLVPFLAIAGLAIIYTYNKVGKNSIKGMGLIFDTAYGKEEMIPKRLIPLVILSTWVTHLFGGSAGREGVAVQIGATVANGIGDRINIKNSKRSFLIIGMAAGFAGLFQTPIAAVFFALEVLMAGLLEYTALLPALIAAFTASFTSNYLGLEKFTFALQTNIAFDINTILKVSVAAILFGIVGGFFAHLLAYCKAKFNKIFKNLYIKIIVVGALLSILFIILHKGRYCGLGTNLISMSFGTNEIYVYDWILKFALTIITLSAGYQGGEVTPLFSIGTSLGIILGSLLGLPVELVAALGYAAVFGSATNTLIAPIFIGAEVFGFTYIPFFFISCAIAYVCNGNKSIYSGQKLLDYNNINR